MKFVRAILKNFKLLLRNKASAFVVLIGPLIIMLLVGLAFSGPSTYELSIGVAVSEKTELAEQFLAGLSQDNFIINEFSDVEQCKELIRQGALHTCIAIPDDFRIKNNESVVVTFYVDKTRINFVYQIITDIKDRIGVKTSQISKELTEQLLEVIEESYTNLSVRMEELDVVAEDSSAVQRKGRNIISDLSEINLTAEPISVSALETAVDVYVARMILFDNLSHDVIQEGNKLLSNLDAIGFSDTAGLEDSLDDLTTLRNSTTTSKPDWDEAYEEALDAVVMKINDINDRIQEASEKRNDASVELGELNAATNLLEDKIMKTKDALDGMRSDIRALEITSSERIVSPITTTVEPITTNASQISFAFPYLIILVIMLIGLMLSSTLVLMEKKSKAAFRNFTSPTSDLFFMTTSFFTSFIILSLQILVVLYASSFFISFNLFASQTGLFVVLLAMILFILLGMIVGYALNTQESSTMFSLSIASVFLFLSNLILPIESMTKSVQVLAKLNPYVLVSETLRKVTVFNAPYEVIEQNMNLIVFYIFIGIVLLAAIQRIAKSRFLENIPSIITKQQVLRPEDNYFKTKDGKFARNLKELFGAVERMDEEEFREKQFELGEISAWIRQHLKKRVLALRIRKSKKERVLKLIHDEIIKDSVKKHLKIQETHIEQEVKNTRKGKKRG
ncbi:MAG: ABC transporter permease [Candidatus Woesearchaeota archaeon]|nr:MAG: ABC transporter permease [Candidatus Woesearchaeota archaeon]